MEKPFTIGFSRQGEMDYPIQYEIVYSETNQKAMFKWIKDNPQDIWRSYSNEPSTEEDIKKFSKNKIEQISMKPEQLRKGNLMTNNADGSLIIVKAYDIYCLEEGMDSMIMQPITITEEWLVRFLFEKQNEKSKYLFFYTLKSRCNKIFIIGSESFYIISENKTTKMAEKIEIKKPKYIHQLQNLFFALTGEELTLKN